MNKQEYIDLWLVETILKTNHTQEINWLKNLLSTGVRIKNDKNRYVTSNLEELKKRMMSNEKLGY